MGEWLASKATAYLAKPVCKIVGSRIFRNPPAPTPHAHNADQLKPGKTAFGIHHSTTKSKDGSAETADAAFPTLKTFRELGARLNALKELNRSH